MKEKRSREVFRGGILLYFLIRNVFYLEKGNEMREKQKKRIRKQLLSWLLIFSVLSTTGVSSVQAAGMTLKDELGTEEIVVENTAVEMEEEIIAAKEEKEEIKFSVNQDEKIEVLDENRENIIQKQLQT